MSDSSRMEIMWGVAVLDEGFTSFPNLLIRNYRRIGMEHGEYGFISQLLSYKHDARDPYPSRELLAANLCCSTRQIDKWVKSLKTKGLLRTGRRRNVHNKQWDNNIYSFKPLLDALLRLVGEDSLPSPVDEFEVIWDDDDNDPLVPQVRMDSVPQVRMDSVPQVRTKKKSKNNHIKDDCLIEAAAAEIAAAHSELSASLESEHDEIYEALQQHAPIYCYIDNNLAMGPDYIRDAYLMLVNQFKNQLSPEVVRIACELYFDRACRTQSPEGVVMKQRIENPTGFLQWCYKDAIKQYKTSSRTKRKRATI